MSSFFQKTNLLIIKLLNKGLLERMVPVFLALQFPLSPLSLRFATRMPARTGLWEKSFYSFYFLALKKRNPLSCFCKICITFIKNTYPCISHRNMHSLFRYNQGKKSLPQLLPSQSMRRISDETITRFVL